MTSWVDRIVKEVLSRAQVVSEHPGAYDPTYMWGFKVILSDDEPVGVQVLIPEEVDQNLMKELNSLAGVYNLNYTLQPVGTFIAVWFWKKSQGEEE